MCLFPHLKNGDNSIHLTELLWGIKELVLVRHTEHCLAHAKHSVTVSGNFYCVASTLYRRVIWDPERQARLLGLHPGPLTLRAGCSHATRLSVITTQPSWRCSKVPDDHRWSLCITELTFPQLEVEADYLSNSIEEWIQLWVFLSYLKCPQNGIIWLKLKTAWQGWRKVDLHYPALPRVSQCQPSWGRSHRYPPSAANCLEIPSPLESKMLVYFLHCNAVEMVIGDEAYNQYILLMEWYFFFLLWKTIIISMTGLTIGGMLK